MPKPKAPPGMGTPVKRPPKKSFVPAEITPERMKEIREAGKRLWMVKK